MSTKDCSVWILQNYNIPRNDILVIIDKISHFYDLIILDKFQDIRKDSDESNVFRKVSRRLRNNRDIIQEGLFENAYILLNHGTKKMELSRALEILNVTSISELHAALIYNQEETAKYNSEKLIQSIKNYNNSNINKSLIIKHLILYHAFQEKKIEKDTLIDKITDSLQTKYSHLNINPEKTFIELELLIGNDYILYEDGICYFPTNIFYTTKKTISLLDYIQTEFEDKEILLHRFDGKTLDEIGNIFNITRERIRQRQAKAIKNMPQVSEVQRFKSIFEKYGFDKDEFVKLFNVDDRIYNYLSIVLVKGKEDPGEYILHSHNFSGSQKLEYLERHQYYFNRFGEIIKIRKNEFVEEVLYKYKDQQFHIDNLHKIYTEEANKYPQHDLIINQVRSIEGMAARSNYIINSNRKRIRYKDLTPGGDDEILKGILNRLPKGAYSMKKLFTEYKEMMEQLDFRDEYELHNFYKKRFDLVNEDIKLTRSPEFLIGDTDKIEFIKEKLIEFTGQPIDDLVDYLHDEYGFRKNTILSYLQMNFRAYIEKRIIKKADFNLNEADLANLKTIFNQPIYIKEEVVRTLAQHNLSFNSILIDKIGYYITGNVVFKKELNNVKSAVLSLIPDNKVWRRRINAFDSSSEMSLILANMERSRDIIMLDYDTYVKPSFLRNNNIDLKLINNYLETIYELLPEKEYFTLYSLEQKDLQHSLIDLGFEAIFYERIIGTSHLYNVVNRGSPALFAKGYETPVSIDKFLLHVFRFYSESVDIYDFKDDLRDKYGLDFDIYDIQVRLQNNNIYYSTELEKLYSDKKNFLDEVYS